MLQRESAEGGNLGRQRPLDIPLLHSITNNVHHDRSVGKASSLRRYVAASQTAALSIATTRSRLLLNENGVSLWFHGDVRLRNGSTN